MGASIESETESAAKRPSIFYITSPRKSENDADLFRPSPCRQSVASGRSVAGECEARFGKRKPANDAGPDGHRADWAGRTRLRHLFPAAPRQHYLHRDAD